MRAVVISQIATLSSLGADLDALWQGLLEGKTGIAPLKRFATDNYISDYAACITDLQAGPEASLLDAVLEKIAGQLGPLPAATRLLVASTKGEIDFLTGSCRRESVKLPETLLFEPLLAKIARRFGLQETGININAACASSTVAVGRAAAMIANGTADSVLVYAADLVSEFVFSGFSALQALSDQPCRPFDQQRNGLTLGEAGAALLLMSEERAAVLGEQPLAYVAGWGAANDAHHVTAPARDGCGLILACREAMKSAGISPTQIAAINAHGTGTVYNDAMELTAFNVVFDGTLPPVHGIKGSLGHCLGAAGAVEIAVGCKSLQQQRIPGTVGCRQAEPAGHSSLTAQSQHICGDYLLCSNSGFGGINGVVILRGSQR